ncbi:unnamed protein product [Cuscuta europaea]|uniref:Proliferating cell nuclear antigen PCNA C-terminal domain-containing protein n=1 Tax=Cuscuta europaea TaxID=41803 RepID=A0A9P0ZIG4_CUSEU|nr:unnamed protein product [Cuscuta europaea]
MLRLRVSGSELNTVMKAVRPILEDGNHVLVFSASGVLMNGADSAEVIVVNADIKAWIEIKSDTGYNDRKITMRLDLNRMDAICGACAGCVICIEIDQEKKTISFKKDLDAPPFTLTYLELPDLMAPPPLLQVAEEDYHATVKLPSLLFTRIIGELCYTDERGNTALYVDARMGPISVPDPEASRLEDDEIVISVTDKGIKFSIRGYSVFLKRNSAMSFRFQHPVSLKFEAVLLELLIDASLWSESVTMWFYPDSPLRFQFNIVNGQRYSRSGTRDPQVKEHVICFDVEEIRDSGKC